MKAKFFMGPKDGSEEEVQTSNGFAPQLYQTDGLDKKIAYYDLQEVKDGIAHYRYRCTV